MKQTNRQNTRRGFRVGFTLIELVVSLSISSILLIAIGGTITIAVQALPSNSDSSTVYLDRASSMNALATDLRYATSVIASSATMIEFTVADRDDDNVEETIRYEWSGTTGDGRIGPAGCHRHGDDRHGSNRSA